MSDSTLATRDPSLDDDVLDSRTAVTWSWRLVWFGVAIRVIRYLCLFPIWQDEQFLALNLLDHDYAGLCGGLDQDQAAPLGFLLTTKWLVETFGMNEYTLRFIAVVCGSAGLILFRNLAARLLNGTALVVAVGVLAVAYFPIRHAAELKPYACDLCFSTWLILWALDWRRESQRLGYAVRFIALAAVSPLFSFPSIFVLGGIGLTMLPLVVRSHSRLLWTTFVAFGLTSACVLGVLFRLSIGEQLATVQASGSIHRYWAAEFPPSWSEPLRWPGWLFEAHTSECLAYPIGSKHSGSIASAVVIYFGAWLLWRRGLRGLPMLASAMCVITLGAACLQRYPYGNGERVQQFWAPLLCIFFGAGAAGLIRRSASLVVRRRAVYGVVGLLTILGIGWTIDAQVRGYKHRWDRDHQAFCRWFWRFAADGAPQLCIHDDLGWPLYSRNEQKAYLVHRAIYRPDRKRTAADLLASCAPGNTIECVAFELDGQCRDGQQFQRWMETMQRHYRLVAEHVYPVMIDAKPGKTAKYYVWRFEPTSSDVQVSAVVQGAVPIVADSRR